MYFLPDNVTDGFFTLVNSVMKALHFWVHFDSLETHQLLLNVTVNIDILSTSHFSSPL